MMWRHEQWRPLAMAAPIVLVTLLAAGSLASQPQAAPNAWSEILLRMKVDLLNQAGEVTQRDHPLSDLLSSDGPTVIGFWATYCPPCIEEMALFNELHREGHRIVGLSLDTGQAEAVKTIWTRQKVRYRGAILPPRALHDVGRLLERGLPTTIVLDRNGNMVVELQGLTTRRALLDAVRAAREGSKKTP
jgi:thiol-disulfide isomerase/thioredoxin